ncbi:PIN domain-containing protein [Candidatus Woesearchaeota archaeon]|nr:PIN domain-containing protein [Candidatus Woesearchaeota archaeon]
MNQEKPGTEQIIYYDTYALYAIALGQENYLSFAKGFHIKTSLMNLYELYYSLLRDGKEQLAEKFLLRILPSCIEITSDIVKNAAKFRLENSRLKLSYIDCLGYTIAKSHNIKFLTGDLGFRDLQDVIFVR